jgi:selenocysteine lyase/cysteine desulfurase
MDKRTFLRKLSFLSLAAIPTAKGLSNWIELHENIDPNMLASDEEFWHGIRMGYRLKPDYINLESGFYNIQPQRTLENFIKNVRYVNYLGSYYMRTVQRDNKKRMAEKLARLAGCSPEELIITRNTTESLDLVIGGLDWEEGDEAIMAEQDYGAMINHFKLVGKRYGVVNKILSVPNHPKSDEELVKLYEDAITDKTKLLMICHMINITGHILPVRKICDMAHSHGVKVMVDGAHTFGHINFNMEDLNCDYFGASLHKWLSVPLGSGILYVRKDNIATLWPLLASGNDNMDDIYRLNHIGTHPVHTDLTVSDAIDYYMMIGPERKESRLRYLQRYWSDQVRGLPNIILNTPEEPHRSCAIANVGVKGINPKDLANILFEKYNIYTVGIDGQNVHGCRITPNVFTTPAELDVLVKALKELSV